MCTSHNGLIFLDPVFSNTDDDDDNITDDIPSPESLLKGKYYYLVTVTLIPTPTCQTDHCILGTANLNLFGKQSADQQLIDDPFVSAKTQTTNQLLDRVLAFQQAQQASQM